MRFCDAHFARLQADVSDRDITPESVSELVKKRMGFSRVREGECPVCVAARDTAALVETRWIESVALAILTHMPPRWP